MSQWNNTFYNQNHAPNQLNNQEIHNNYYPNANSNQYVSFNEFINQIQTTGAVSAANNMHHPSYPVVSQISYANVPSGSYSASNYPEHFAGHNAQASASVPENVVLKSKLTATAMEFVPKSAKASEQSQPEASVSSSSSKKVNSNSTLKNWRDRPSSSSHNSETSNRSNFNSNSKKHSANDSNKNNESETDKWNGSRNEREYYDSRNNKSNHRSGNNQQSSEYNNETDRNDNRNERPKNESRNNRSFHESKNNNQNYKNRNERHNFEANNDNNAHRDQDSGFRGRNRNERQNYQSSNERDIYESRHDRPRGNKQNNNPRNDRETYESTNNRSNYESKNNRQSYKNRNDRQKDELNNESENLESNERENFGSRNERSNYDAKKSQRRYKDPSGGKVFYNSSVEPVNEELGSNRGESSRHKNWAGSQRLRGSERNNQDDEHFANNYNNYNNEGDRWDTKSDSGRLERDRTSDDRFDRENYRERYNKERDRPRTHQDRQDRDWVGDRNSNRLDRNRYDKQDRNKENDKQDRNRERQNKEQNAASPAKHKSKQHPVENDLMKELTQRERLTEQLDNGSLECLVCCERVKQVDAVWACANCYHVLHLRCVRKWAVSSMQEGKWRCPACQNTCALVPGEYRCLCGATRAPEWSRGAWGAHTCGAPCRRARACSHACTLLCHPGPCPPCQATQTRKCGCGEETRSVVCSSKLPQECGRQCGKLLDCGRHRCELTCHDSPCEPCTKIIDQECYCVVATRRTLACSESGGALQYACGALCGRVRGCGRHACGAPCHAPPCTPCPLAPSAVTACPCGKTRLEKGSRKSCTDPIPLCGNICAKPLPCGPEGDRHFCRQECHHGDCPPCPDKTVLNCRCGHSTQEVPCAELPQMIDNVFCKKKCNKKLSCGRHRCRSLCCSDARHRCGAACARSLPCGNHRCELLCHTGHCAPCTVLGFVEVSCACGASVLLPPVPCGARPPACSRPCARVRACSHDALHACHAGDCPPCVVLTAKRCHGLHEERKTIPCSQEEFSCGMPCGKPLPCGKHNCIKVCHKGPCDTEVCRQACRELRPACGHECGGACHAGAGAGTSEGVGDEAGASAGAGAATPCPSRAPCRAVVRVTCACGRRTQQLPCHEHAAQQARLLSALVATKMQEGETVDVSEATRPTMNLKTLECDSACLVEARARRLALALQLRNPDVSAKLAPRYSDAVRAWATRDPAFLRTVHDALSRLVQLAKKSKQKTRSHSFPSMNWQKRQLIHELCEHFGCESVAYDAEPNRNVVATADREKSWLPAMSVLEVVAREAGRRRVPGPVLRAPPAPTSSAAPAPGTAAAAATTKSGSRGWATLTPTNAWASRSQPKPVSAEPLPPKIDYFDNPPE